MRVIPRPIGFDFGLQFNHSMSGWKQSGQRGSEETKQTQPPQGGKRRMRKALHNGAFFFD
jgi:hypothetical protein